MWVASTPVMVAPPLSPPCHTGTQGGIVYLGGPIWRPFLSQWLRSTAPDDPPVPPVPPVADSDPPLPDPPVPVEDPPTELPPVPDATPLSPAAASLDNVLPFTAPLATSPARTAWGPLDGATATNSTCTAAMAMNGRYRRPRELGVSAIVSPSRDVRHSGRYV